MQYSTEFSPKELKHLSPDDRKQIIRYILLKELDKTRELGTTPTEIATLTNLDVRTVSKHLEYLVAVKEANVVKRGSIHFYFPKGKLIHPNLKIDVSFTGTNEEKYFSFSAISNIFGDYICIQERTKDKFNRFSITGGVLINLEFIDEFIEFLEDFVKKVKLWRDTLKGEDTNEGNML